MRLVGYQPQYFPRLHYFARILNTDIFSISDHVQFVKSHSFPVSGGGHKRGKSYQAHSPIKSSQGVQFLTLPIMHGGLLPISQTNVDYSHGWPNKHIGALQMCYGSAARAQEMLSELKGLLKQGYDTLAELNIATIVWALAWILGKDAPHATVDTVNEWLTEPHPFRLQKVVVQSQTSIAPPGEGRDAMEWIIDTCKTLGATEYYHGGTASAAYLDAGRIEAAGITLVEQDWTCPPYVQQFPEDGFMPNLSIIDLVANEGVERVQTVLKG